MRAFCVKADCKHEDVRWRKNSEAVCPENCLKHFTQHPGVNRCSVFSGKKDGRKEGKTEGEGGRRDLKERRKREGKRREGRKEGRKGRKLTKSLTESNGNEAGELQG